MAGAAGNPTTAVGATGSFVATGNGAATVINGVFNISVWGTFVGTAVLERSFDGGTTWIPRIWEFNQSAISLTTPQSAIISEPEYGVQYRFRCSAYTSGTINWRISQ